MRSPELSPLSLRLSRNVAVSARRTGVAPAQALAGLRAADLRNGEGNGYARGGIVPPANSDSGYRSNASCTLNFVPAPGTLAPGRRVYAVGDIHGCSERLSLVHRQIALDVRNRPAEDVTLIHLGDYIDRGPDSAGVLTLLSREPDFPVDRVVNLMGNHEEMALQAIAFGDKKQAENWLANGGQAALTSWGIPRDAQIADWPELLPREHLRFMSRLSLQYRVDGYLFAHAGIRPGTALDQLSRRDLLWIREPFLSSHEGFGAIVVHGHTPQADPVMRSNRIGIDTGAGRGGRLTCALLEADKVAFFAA